MTREEAIAVFNSLAIEMTAILAGIPKNESEAKQIQRYIDAYDMAISALRQQDVTDTNVGKWISVKDRLPEEDGCYLVVERVGSVSFRSVVRYTHKYDGFEEYFLGRAMWYDCDNEYGDYEKTGITHWMPLPEPPEEGTV